MDHKYGYILFPGAVLLIFASIVSLVTPSWTYDGLLTEISEGLWQECVNDACSARKDTPGHVIAVRAFLIIAIISQLATMVLALMVAGSKSASNRQKMISKMLTFCAAATCLCQIVAMVVFTSWNPASKLNQWGYSFVVGWFSATLSIILAFIAFHGMWKEKELHTLSEF